MLGGAIHLPHRIARTRTNDCVNSHPPQPMSSPNAMRTVPNCRTWVFLGAVLVLAAGCDTSAPDPVGSFSLRLNGDVRGNSDLDRAGLTHNPSYGYLLNLQLGTGDRYRTHGFVITLPQLSTGPYSLYPHEYNGFFYEALFFETYDQQPAGSYEIVSPGDSLTIVEYNENTGYVKATFAGTYVVENPHAPFRTLPDTLRITEGVVEVTLYNPPASR